MEGLIPLVIHAIKGNRKRSKYSCLSDDSTPAFASAVDSVPPLRANKGVPSPSPHRTTTPELQGSHPPPQPDHHSRRLAQSRTVKHHDAPLPGAAIMRRTVSSGIW
uniref:Protein-methionine sulfoxide oxidase mical1 n=1 Tax=Anthurium amnicola TaxID=1678845 RepID=A0A1D1YCS3_9ARAE